MLWYSLRFSVRLQLKDTSSDVLYIACGIFLCSSTKHSTHAICDSQQLMHVYEREREWVLPTQQVTWSLNYWMLKNYLKNYSLSLIYMHELLTLLTLILITVQVNVFCSETIGLFKKNIHISHVLKIHFQPSLINYAHFSLSNQFSLDKLYKRLNKKMKSCYSLFLLLHSEIH